MLKPVKILCVGMIFCDTYVHGVDSGFMDLPKDTYVVADKLEFFFGGDAQNMAINLLRMGHVPKLIGCIGDDGNGMALTRELQRIGMDISGIRTTQQAHTANVIFVVDDTGSIHGMSYAGANAYLQQTDVSDADLSAHTHLHLGSLGPLTALNGQGAATLLRRAKMHGATTSMDISLPYGCWEDVAEALPHCDIFMPNDDEVLALTGLRDLDAIKALFAPYGLKVLVVKMGSEGVFVTDFVQDIRLPSLLHGDLVDVLGAGDAFCTGFISAYHNGLDLYNCTVYASTCSALCLQTMGASNWGVNMNAIADTAKQLGHPLNAK
ncbi:carbohydrate kinase family protein [Eubacteriales bacterium OttesenSCG-928-N14]|nr:carbohydrate kinase family protein [Eubacteriales bacterium OttesenSCG-928-N14]